MSVDLGTLTGQDLATVQFDLHRASLALQVGATRLVFLEVRASTLLSPWDGTRASVEWLRLVHQSGGECCYELRVQFEEVPRVYRVVCAGLRVEG